MKPDLKYKSGKICIVKRSIQHFSSCAEMPWGKLFLDNGLSKCHWFCHYMAGGFNYVSLFLKLAHGSWERWYITVGW